jgi:exosortase B
MNLAVATQWTGRPALPWWLAGAGLVGLYLPSLVDLFRSIWGSSEQAHGPIVLGVALWLLYRQWPRMQSVAAESSPSDLGWPVLAFGLLLYVVGRSQGVMLFEIGSLIWVLVGIGLLFAGRRAVLSQWFPLFFMLFMLPLPSPVVDALTMPMKMAVSHVADQILFAAGYPIARVGVILHIRQYQMLVADACAGLHTLFTLEAMGLLYLNLVRHDSLLRNVSLALLIVPISFTANVIRVIALVLVTYYLGDDAGQGFLHGLAAVVLFLSALLLVSAVDSALQYAIGAKRKREAPGGGEMARS